VNFQLTSDQQILVDSIRRYCVDNFPLGGNRQAAQSEPRLRDQWSSFARLGATGVTFGNDVGGSAQSLVELVLIMQELGRRLVRLPFITCVVLAGQILDYAADPQRRLELLSPMIAGESLLAAAYEEENCDNGTMNTQASPTPRGYRISGCKWLPCGHLEADMFIVSAYCGLNSHSALFAVPRSTEGMTIKQFATLDDDVALELHFDDAEIPASSMIADGNRASAAMSHAHRHGIVALCAEAMGAMESVVTATAEHLKSRVAYGVPLSSLQVLQHKLADMVAERELSRSVMYRAINALVNHDEPTMESAVATAKAYMGDSARSIAATALQLHGAAGFARDNVISSYFKKLNAFGLRLGTTDHHVKQLAGHWDTRVRQSTLSDQIPNQAPSGART